MLEKGEKCWEWQLRKAGGKWDKNKAVVHLMHVGVLMQPCRLEILLRQRLQRDLHL